MGKLQNKSGIFQRGKPRKEGKGVEKRALLRFVVTSRIFSLCVQTFDAHEDDNHLGYGAM
jgi:hypothetical protein